MREENKKNSKNEVFLSHFHFKFRLTIIEGSQEPVLGTLGPKAIQGRKKSRTNDRLPRRLHPSRGGGIQPDYRQEINGGKEEDSHFIEIGTKRSLFARKIMRSANSSDHVDGQATINLNLVPYWERERGRLWYGNILVKEFHQPAPFQRRALDAFQESNWKSRIDDPLPWDQNVDRQERLRNIAKGLNRCQIIPIFEFWTDGRGVGLCWSIRQSAHRGAPPRTDEP